MSRHNPRRARQYICRMMRRSVLCVLAVLALSVAAVAQPKMPPDYRWTGAPIPPFVLGRPDGHFLTNAIVHKRSSANVPRAP